MNNDSIVTVVMAVYNASKTLHRAIDSLINQTYSNWLLICVNDGSTDNSLEILQQYALNDPRIKVLSQKNGGPAAARAKAYEIVSTPYAIILDSDDTYSSDLLECLTETALRTHADAIVPNVRIEQTDGSFMDWNQTFHFYADMEMKGEEAFSRTLIRASMHGINMWKSELIRLFALNNNATYNRINADEYIQRLLFLNCKKVVFSNGTYYYRRNKNSITQKYSVRHLGYLDTCRKLIALIPEYHLTHHTASIIKEFYFRHIIHLQIRLYSDGKDLNTEERKEMKQAIKAAYMDAMAYKNDFQFKEKRMPNLYKMASTSGYILFCLTCIIFAKYKKHQ